MKLNNIIHKVIQYIDEAGVIGIILYGSYGLGKADNLSDIDIAVITEYGKEYFEYIESGDHDLDIAYIPKQIFEKVLEETHSRSNHSLWLTHSFYLRILATGRIIYYPHSMIKEYKEAIKQWKWTQQDIENARKHPSLGEISVKEYGRYGLTEASYLIGPIILYIIREVFGENCLWNTLRTFIEKYSKKPAKLEDLIYVFEKTYNSVIGRLIEKLLFTNMLAKLLCEKNSIQEVLRELRSSMSSTLG